MIEELVKEKHEEINRKEEEKIFSAIHQQAKESYYFEKGRRYLANIKAQKKEPKNRMLEDTLNFGLLIFVIPVLILLAVIC